MIYTQIEELIGNTPLLHIDGTRYGIHHSDIYVKLEYLNPFGSVKDRTALGLVKDANLETMHTTGRQLIESSSGNTAKALQLLASRHDIRMTSVTNRIKIPEVERQLRYLGAEIIALPGRSECPDPNDDNNALAVIDTMLAKEPYKYYHTSQYDNVQNTAIHELTTAKELYDTLGNIDVMVTGIGTGGSSGGVIQYAKNNSKNTAFVGVVAHPSDFLPGIRTKNELFETKLFHEDDFDEIREVSSSDALVALGKLVRNEGVLAGPTTGANFAAMIDYLKSYDMPRQDGTKQSVVFIACDRLESYMSYIEKRQPELFGSNAHSDIYGVVSDEEGLARLTKPATKETQLWINDSKALVVDMRGAKPFSRFHIKDSVSYPEEILKEVLGDGTPFSKEGTVLLVCPTGDRSLPLARVLQARGVGAYSLEGGLREWRNHGLPLVRQLV